MNTGIALILVICIATTFLGVWIWTVEKRLEELEQRLDPPEDSETERCGSQTRGPGKGS